MEKTNTSNSNPSMCRKICHVFSSNPAIRAFHRISSYPHQEPKPITIDSNSPSSTPTNTPIKTKPPIIPQHHKTNIEISGAIPIKFEKPVAATGAHAKAPIVGNNSARPTKDDDVFKGGEQHSSEKKGKKSMDINDTFNDYIKRAKVKIRTVSNLGRGQNPTTTTTASDHDQAHHHGTTNKKDSNKDQFSDFIHHAKKKFRTTTIVGKRG